MAVATTPARLDQVLQARLADRGRRAVRRRLRPIDGIGPRVAVDGRSVLQLCSNDYLGLAAHPAVTRAAADAALAYGAGAGSARLIAGTSAPHAALERDFTYRHVVAVPAPPFVDFFAATR